MTFFKIGDVVKAKKFGQLEHDFTGTVEKVYDNSIMMSIDDFDPADKTSVNELNKRAVVRKSSAKILNAVPRTHSTFSPVWHQALAWSPWGIQRS